MLMHNEIRQSITNSIVEHLESGKVAPWRRPWTLDRNAGAPANIVSKRNYSRNQSARLGGSFHALSLLSRANGGRLSTNGSNWVAG